MSHRIIFLLLVLTSVLAVRISSFNLGYKSYPEGSSISFETKVQNQPKISSKGQRVSLNLPNSQRASVLFGLEEIINYGDSVRVEGEIKYFTSDSGSKVALINYPKFTMISRGSQGNFIVGIRAKIIRFFEQTLSNTHSSLVLGIVFGIKEEMPAVFHDNLQKTGLLHVIAASGMNIPMVG